MKYYGYTKEKLDKMLELFNVVSVTGMAQIDAYSEATTLLRRPVEINAPEEGVKKDGN
jgi:hypothetical protein